MNNAAHIPPTHPSSPAKPLAPDSFPRWVLLCAGGVVAFSLISVGLVRITGNGPDQKPAPGTMERALRFEDRPDGSIAVIDGRTGELVRSFQGEQGFLRGTLRALARERKSRGLGSEQPFQLIARTDGGLTLFDPVTQQRVDLESFGPTNAGAFAPLLTAGPDSAPNPVSQPAKP
jgi:putative photosynthetic complex assembly protein